MPIVTKIIEHDGCFTIVKIKTDIHPQNRFVAHDDYENDLIDDRFVISYEGPMSYKDCVPKFNFLRSMESHLNKMYPK